MFEQLSDQNREESKRLSGPLIGIGASILVPLFLFLHFHTESSSPVPWAVSGKTLQIHAGLAWREDYPVCELETDKAQVINLSATPEWRPSRKIFGYDGGNDYGNFYLRNGKEVEIALGDETVAVFMPRDGKIPVMVGVRDATAFLSAVRNACK